MQQFAQDDTVNVRKCAVVKEYTESGRADLKANDDEKCTKGQVCMTGRTGLDRYACDAIRFSPSQAFSIL